MDASINKWLWYSGIYRVGKGGGGDCAVLRRGRLDSVVTTGRLKGKQGTGRPGMKILDNLTLWH